MRIEELVARPRESLSVELKAWIDPRTPEGVAKIVKACMALRNRNGGYLLVGFDDRNHSPLTPYPFADPVEQLFHQDAIQSLISRYSSEQFEVRVHFVPLEGMEMPVVEIPTGIRSPAVAKADLKDGRENRLIEANAVYVRSLAANNRVSTTKASWKDYAALMETCMENREADIGRFVRRHLVGTDIGTLQEALSVIIGSENEKAADIESQLGDFMAFGNTRYCAVVVERSLDLPQHGAWETAFIIRGETVRDLQVDQNFLTLLSSVNPQFTGWPVWLDSRGFSVQGDRPYVFDGGWEALIFSMGGIGYPHIDFQRMEASGRFYLRRAFEDDISTDRRAPKPMAVLDLILHVYRVAEAIAVGIEFAKGMGYSSAESQLEFGFRWSKLKDRELSSWSDSRRFIMPGYKAYQDVVLSKVVVPLETVGSSIFEFVHEAVCPLAIAFGGFEISKQVTEEITRQLLERR